jgi:hypothetical protein
MPFNTGDSDSEGIFAIYDSMSVISVLSFLHFLLQDLRFNGNHIDFVHQNFFGDGEMRSVELMRCRFNAELFRLKCL